MQSGYGLDPACYRHRQPIEGHQTKPFNHLSEMPRAMLSVDDATGTGCIKRYIPTASRQREIAMALSCESMPFSAGLNGVEAQVF